MYTIYNHGTPHAFYPNKKVIDPYNNKETILLEVHKEYARTVADKLVYIVNDENKKIDL